MKSNKHLKTPRILTIAGSDPSGGAGIQADIKTITSLDGFATTAITSLTVQNTQKVFDLFPITGQLVTDQINAVLSDIGADCIKIGMLVNDDIIQAVIKALKKYPNIPVVLDPVMVASTGNKLLDPEAISIVKKDLLPLVDIITPNISEAYQLTGVSCNSVEEMKEAGKSLLEMGVSAVVVKGGHLSGENLTNVLVTDKDVYEFSSNKINSKNTHGTGCVFSSALATYIGGGKALEESVKLAGNFVHTAIQNAPGLGKGFGPLGPK